MGIPGNVIIFSKTGISALIVAIFVIIPTLLYKTGFLADNVFVEFFTQYLVTFCVIVFAGLIATYHYLRPTWFSLVHIAALLAVAYLYVHFILGG